MSEEDPARQMSRVEAAAYLTTKGLKLSPVTLAKYAVGGTGPKFTKVDGDRKVYYTLADLDAYVTDPSRPKRGSSGLGSGHGRRPGSKNKMTAAMITPGDEQVLPAVLEYMAVVERIVTGGATFSDGVEYARVAEKLRQLMKR